MRMLFLCLFVCTGTFLLSPVHAQDDAPSDVAASAASLDKWLGTDANGQKWRDYLLLKSLLAEVAGDREANPAVLVEVWRRFTSGEAGLEGKRFQAVRVDLEKHLNNRVKFSRTSIAGLAKDAGEKYAAPAPPAITAAENELRQAMAAVQAILTRLPASQLAAARKHFDFAAIQAIATGKGSESQFEDLALDLGKYRWLVYEPRYIEAVDRLKVVKKPQGENVTELSAWNETKVNGLEGAAFSRLRNAISHLRNLRETAADQEGQQTTQQELETLAADVAKAEAVLATNNVPVGIDPAKLEPLPLPSSVTAAAAIGNLQRAGQARNVTSEAVRGYSLPNLVVYSSRDFFAGGLEQDIDRIRPISDVIMGTSIHGTAHIIGETRVNMLTNPLVAGYQINLGAVANSNTVGYNGPVTIFSTGVTQLHGQKKLHFDDEIGGMQPSPATAQASTCTSINDICARSRLVTRIAWKRAMASKGAAEAEASAKAAQNLRTEMDQQAVESTGNINKNFADKFRHPLIIRHEYPRQFVTASSSKQMQVVLSQLSVGQLGAPTTPPPAPTGDIVAQIHESYVLNYARGMFAGQTFSALEIRQMQEQMGGTPPPLEKIAKTRKYESNDDAVAKLAGTLITFDAEHPLRVEFRGGHVLIVMRIEKMERVKTYGGPADSRAVRSRGLEVAALYELVQKDGDWVLQRDEMDENTPEPAEGEVAPPVPVVRRGVYHGHYTQERIGFGVRNEQAIVTKRMRAEVFPIEIKLGPMKFKGRTDGKEAFGNWSKLDDLPTTTAKSAEGWLSLAWTLQPWVYKDKRPADKQPAEDKPADGKPADPKPAEPKPAAAK